MSRRMTNDEAAEMIETVFEQGVDTIGTGIVSATVGDMDVSTAQKEIDGYMHIVPGDIDPDSITILRDVVEGSDIDCVAITIKTAV